LAEIAPEANRAKATVQVKIKVDNPDEQLRPEMNARVNFMAEQQTTKANHRNSDGFQAPLCGKDGLLLFCR